MNNFNLKLLETLPEDMVYIITSYLPIEQIRKYLIYRRYYKTCYTALQPFTIQELNMHFHNTDYFGMANNKNVSIKNYISYNLNRIWSPKYFTNSMPVNPELIDDDSYHALKKIIICSRIKSAIVRMKKRSL
jgi:hypothetical protein